MKLNAIVENYQNLPLHILIQEIEDNAMYKL